MKIDPGKGWRLLRYREKILGYCEIFTPDGWRICPVFFGYALPGPVAKAFRVRK